MDLLSDILQNLELAGTLYFRTSFTSPWSIRVPAYENVARFHFVHKGRCLVRISPNEPPVVLERGDLLIIMRGAAHNLFCDPATEHQAVLLDKVVEQSGFSGHGTLVYGELGTHHETQLVCGHFTFDAEASTFLLDALPAHIHIQNYGDASGSWMENTLKVIGQEAGGTRLGSDLIAIKMSEIIFAQALRTFIDEQGARMPVLRGFTDSSISKTLAEIHRAPEYPWTLEKMAAVAGMSRSAFAARFNKLLTVTPAHYLTDWRMQIAQRRLRTTSDPIIEVAEKAGYNSEAAFGRAFKRYRNCTPVAYRKSFAEIPADKPET